MDSRTKSLNSLARPLGVLVVVEPRRPTASVYADAPDEVLIKACLQDGLAEATAGSEIEEE